MTNFTKGVRGFRYPQVTGTIMLSRYHRFWKQPYGRFRVMGIYIRNDGPKNFSSQAAGTNIDQ